jgi:hypothetical protein
MRRDTGADRFLIRQTVLIHSHGRTRSGDQGTAGPQEIFAPVDKDAITDLNEGSRLT